MNVRRFSHFAVLASSMGLAGCTGNIGGDPAATDAGPPPPPDVTPREVPANPEVLVATGVCTPMGAGEQLLSVSPEGHAWLATEGDGVVTLRVLDALGSEMETISTDVALAGIAQLQAWSDADAAVLDAEGLWVLDDLARVQLRAPEDFGGPAVLCGDPATNGFALAGGTLFERRLDAQWWAWAPQAEGDAVPNQLLTYDGECQSTHDVVWMTSPDGTLWRVEPTVYDHPVRFASLRAGAVTDTLVAILEQDRLWIGPDAWQPWIFPGEVPSALSASGGFVWMEADGKLLRFDGETFVAVDHLLGSAIASVHAYSSGVWLVGDDEICHQAVSPLIRVDGLRSYSRSTELLYDFSVVSNDAEAELTADLDGELVELTWDAETAAFLGRARLDVAGWHALQIEALGADGTATRRAVAVKRIPTEVRSWEADILPIYENNCTGSSCHSAGSTENIPDLGTYAAWQTYADAIRTRVVSAGTMPPPASRKPEWGDDDVAIIAEWLEGGMLP